MATELVNSVKAQLVPKSGSESSPALPSRSELYAAGKALRQQCPRESHATWRAPSDRRDALELVLAAEEGRVASLLPLRHGRMVRSPFTFYRGAALTMAADLATTPSTGVYVQACGDAHLCNFGGFATPERRVLFSVNDLDETLPAPWEWDVKRLAASFVVACRDNGLSDSQAWEITAGCVRSYRKSMREFSRLKTLDLWYSGMWADELVASIKEKDVQKRVLKRMKKEKAKSRAQEIFPKLVVQKGDVPVIRDELPTIFHVEGHTPGQIQEAVSDAMKGYRSTLTPSVQALYDRYKLRDAAIKVVGVGSVGTLCWILLLMAGDEDPLFLQVKQARRSVLEDYAGASEFSNHGQRVVNGYRMMQPASDMFLGWTKVKLRGLHYFIRQLRDIKISPRVETFGFLEMKMFADWCGRALSLSHARSGQSSLLSGYMGKSEAFDEAIASFSVAYADQNESDHTVFARAVKDGKVEATIEEEAG